MVYLRREGRGAEILAPSSGEGNSPRRTRRTPSTDPSTRDREFREYGIGAQILRGNFPRNLVSLPGYGLEIVECVPLRVSSQGGDRRTAPRGARRHGSHLH